MELRHIRYFLAVTQSLNFTKAAQQLHIAQPPLTRAASTTVPTILVPSCPARESQLVPVAIAGPSPARVSENAGNTARIGIVIPAKPTPVGSIAIGGVAHV
ncbi:MAG TPA: LysR family transcriptional regulator [Terriglobales bacterium]|nr:LysR family transcriptional regulator [Terriglobales bacterium]